MKLKLFLLAILIVLVGENSIAITTPQTYCASLPAVSCEVLNTEMMQNTSGPYPFVTIIKYCRNKIFSIIFYSSNPAAGGLMTLNDPGNGPIVVKMDTPSLCAAAYPPGWAKVLP